MERRNRIITIPFPSTNAEHPEYYSKQGSIVLEIVGVDLDGKYIKSKITFTSVRAMRKRAEGHCTSWHIQAYDTVTLIEDSEWIRDILKESGTWFQDYGKHFTLNHYIIYLDSFGCLEVIGDKVFIENDVFLE